jgi:hypothetical protein
MTRFPYNEPGSSRYGARLGRPAIGGTPDRPERLNLRPVPLSQGYDGGGAYWGVRPLGVRLWCAWTRDRSYVRWIDARTRAAAQAVAREEFPEAVF